jgi:Na+/H+ antiporter NhaD/arsenite permease-like protein
MEVFPTGLQIASTICFMLAIIHTFSVRFFQKYALRYPEGSFQENVFHFLGEVEVVFGLWALVFFGFYCSIENFAAATAYLESRSYTEPLLVFVLMTICSTQPILIFAKSIIQKIAAFIPLNKSLSFYISTMIFGPVLGSFITEPAAMTVTALILLDYFYSQPLSQKLKYATLGLLFVNISIGGTLTSFAAPPVLMVAQKWGWDFQYMITHFGWKALVAILISTLIVAFRFKSELIKVETAQTKKPVIQMPKWVVLSHLVFLALIVMNHHHPVLFIFLFLFFLGLATATQEYQTPIQMKSPLLVSFFLGGLIILGGMQGWWLSEVLGYFGNFTLYTGAALLTSVTDNAAITYLGSQVEGLSELSKYALVAGSVVGGGLTVIANAPNPAGYSLLNSSFGDEGISAYHLFKAALGPTLITFILFWVL